MAFPSLAMNETNLRPQDVFSHDVYMGTGAAQTITNNVNLLDNGGMVLAKRRDASGAPAVFDTVRGPQSNLFTSAVSTPVADTLSLTAFLRNGHTLGSDGNYGCCNGPAGGAFNSLTFRKAPRFFDIQTYTGNGTATKIFNHNLGVVPGMVWIKRTDISSSSGWYVYHIGMAAGSYAILNATGGETASTLWTVTSSTFQINTSTGDLNANGASYTAYLWAHDPSTNGMIQCGSTTTTSDGTGNWDVSSLPWRPQFIFWRNVSTTANWVYASVSTGIGKFTCESNYVDIGSVRVAANIYLENFTDTGWDTRKAGNYSNANKIIWMAVREPTAALQPDELFDISHWNGGAATTIVTGVDLLNNKGAVFGLTRTTASSATKVVFDTVRGATKYVKLYATGGETTDATSLTAFTSSGFTLGTDSGLGVINLSGRGFQGLSFRAAPKFFDVVTYTGNGTSQSIAHSLGVAPGMILVILRNGSGIAPFMYHVGANPANGYDPTTTNTFAATTAWNSQSPDASNFYVGANSLTNGNTNTYVAYLWAHDPSPSGIIQCGTFTTDGSGAATTTLGWMPQLVFRKPLAASTTPITVNRASGYFSTGGLADPGINWFDGAPEDTGTDRGYPTTTGFVTASPITATTFVYMAIRNGTLK